MARLNAKKENGVKLVSAEDTAASYRINPASGTTKAFAPGIDPTASGVASCALANKLVFVQLTAMNRAVLKSMKCIPARSADVTEKTVEEFKRHSLEAEYFALREAIIHFVRARHIARCRARGESLTAEFLVDSPTVVGGEDGGSGGGSGGGGGHHRSSAEASAAEVRDEGDVEVVKVVEVVEVLDSSTEEEEAEGQAGGF